MKQNLLAIYIIAGILIIVGTISYFLKSDNQDYSDKIKVIKTFELPYALREISGISHINDSKIACIQDEEGVLFIYDLEKKDVVKEILFGPRGDYESIRIIDSIAYVIESNGKLFKINNFESDSRKIEIYKTGFNNKNDIESLDFLKEKDIFLTIPKRQNLSDKSDDFIIYEINSKTYKVEKEPYFRMKVNDSIFQERESFFTKKHLNPSELTIHPDTKEIYILDSKVPRLLILNPNGSFKNMYKLNPENFQQPEGLSFDSKGRMYISNEESDFLKQNIQLVEWE
ncbi:MAG: SdiA-regulated domain-containing protein [Psychroflexus sp.]